MTDSPHPLARYDSDGPYEPRKIPRRIVFYSLLTGLCPLIPLPLLDDFVRDVLRRRLARDLAAKAGFALHAMEIALLSGTLRSAHQGCLRRLLLGGVFKVLKRLIRKLVIVFMVKDCVETVACTFYDAYLLRHGLARGAAVKPGPLALRAALDEALADANTQPVEKLVRQSLHGSWRVMLQAARQLAKLLRPWAWRRGGLDAAVEEPIELDQQARELSSIVDRISDGLAGQSAHLAELRGQLENHLARQIAIVENAPSTDRP